MPYDTLSSPEAERLKVEAHISGFQIKCDSIRFKETPDLGPTWIPRRLRRRWLVHGDDFRAGAARAGAAREIVEVDVSLEELVSWDVLEQFMQEMPGGSGALASLSGLSQTNLGQAAVDEFAALGKV